MRMQNKDFQEEHAGTLPRGGGLFKLLSQNFTTRIYSDAVSYADFEYFNGILIRQYLM